MKGIIARSPLQCASKCLHLVTPNCKAFIWEEIDKTCTPIDDTVKGDGVDIHMLSELNIYTGYKAGCTTKGYYYDSLSNTCLKMFIDNNGKTWKDARNHCHANDGDLISVTTPSKWEFVIYFTSCQTHMWIGLKDGLWVTNATFKNVFNVTVQFNQYDGHYPNDSEQGSGTFLITHSTVLQDESCNIRLRNIYVCEILK